MQITPEQMQARQAERAQIETARLAEIGAAATHLASVRRMNLKPMNTNLLWAEWQFYKAMKAWDGDGLYDDAFSDICSSLGVDEEGEETPPDPADYGDYLYEQRRDALMEREWERGA
jgi:hypothetical protein